MSHAPEWIDDLYSRIANEEDARVCRDISDDACREVPGNFFLILLSNTLTKIGDRLASPKTTLAWLLQAVGAPPFFTGIIVPLRESGSLIPQLAIAGKIRQLSVRKWVWVIGSAIQAIAVAGMGLVSMWAHGASAGWMIAALLAIFSLARGLSSVASKDVLGKTIPKSRRGRLKGLMTSISGLVAMSSGGLMIYQAYSDSAQPSIQLYTFFLFAAAALWGIATSTYSLVREYAGETEGGGNAGKAALEQFSLLKTDPDFRHFVIVRALAFGSGLGAPFLMSLAHAAIGGGAIWLGIFIAVDGLAALLAGPLVGRMADRSSKSVLRLALMANALLLASVSVVGLMDLSVLAASVVYPFCFFILGILHSGVRVGRKTYLVDMASGNKRTSYVAVSNTLIGILLLLTGILTGILGSYSASLALAFFAVCSVTGWLLGKKLPDVSQD